MLRLVSTTQLLASSLRSKPCTVSGSSSAVFQLPSQISRSGGGTESGFFAGLEGLVARLIQKWQEGHVWHAAGGVDMAVLPRGSYLKGRAVLKRYTLELPLPGFRRCLQRMFGLGETPQDSCECVQSVQMAGTGPALEHC